MIELMRKLGLALFLFLSALVSGQNSARDSINQGVAAFKSAKYAEAVAAFERAVASEPNNVNAHLYLATALMTQWIPGATAPENQELAARAESEFRRVVEISPRDRTALASLASLTYNQKRFDDAKQWNEKLIAVDPSAKEAHYSLGVIAWSKFYPELMAARKQAGMRPEDPGPIRDFNLRSDLRNRFTTVIEQGMDHLAKALEIDARYDDAMASLNLLIREQADLKDTEAEYRADIAIADNWVQKALDTKKMKAGMVSGGIIGAPPPPPPGGGQRIRVGGNVQAANLVQKVEPEYPALAKQARIQGVVRYQVIIGRDGHLENVQLVSGHPLLIPSATEALKQYVYKPTLLNGQPVEVITQVDVNFSLAP